MSYPIIKSFDDFKAFYEENDFLPYPIKTWQKNKKLTECQLKSYWKKYQNKLTKLSHRIHSSEHEREVREKMRLSAKNDPMHLRWVTFFRTLSEDEKNTINGLMWMCPKDKNGRIKFDTAHIIARSESYKLSTDIENMIEIPRPFHKFMDDYRNPLTELHERMTESEHETLWKKLVGNELYEKLKRKAR